MAVFSTKSRPLFRSGRIPAYTGVPRAGVGALRTTNGFKTIPAGTVSTGRGVTGGAPRISKNQAFAAGRRH